VVCVGIDPGSFLRVVVLDAKVERAQRRSAKVAAADARLEVDSAAVVRRRVEVDLRRVIGIGRQQAHGCLRRTVVNVAIHGNAAAVRWHHPLADVHSLSNAGRCALASSNAAADSRMRLALVRHERVRTGQNAAALRHPMPASGNVPDY